MSFIFYKVISPKSSKHANKFHKGTGLSQWMVVLEVLRKNKGNICLMVREWTNFQK